MIAVKPYSVRLPADLREPLTEMARQDRRTLHSLILAILDAAVQERHAAKAESTNAGNADRLAPMTPTQRAYRAGYVD